MIALLIVLVCVKIVRFTPSHSDLRKSFKSRLPVLQRLPELMNSACHIQGRIQKVFPGKEGGGVAGRTSYLAVQ